MHPDAEVIVVTEEQIRYKIKELGKKITKDYQGKELLVVGILKGSIIFMADLIRNIDIPTICDFMTVSSYGSGAKSMGEIKILKDLQEDVTGRDVLIVEDIIDTGATLKYLRDYLLAKGSKSVKICVFTDKAECRITDVPIDYKGFKIPGKFVAGYGMDYNGKYRNVPYVFALKPEIYNK